MSYPKLYSEIATHNASVRRLFAADLEKPVVIVGNGPSSTRPIVGAVPKEALIFRMNWFFLESTQTYGRQVDAYFWSVNQAVMQDELYLSVQRGEYDVRAFFAPMRPDRHQDGKKTIEDRLQPFFDHWSIIAENQTLARELMGRPLPTQGFQAFAFALSMGFRDIYLTGIDLYDPKLPRYSYSIPDRIARQMVSKDLRPGYENDHSYDRDVSFFQACLAQFPDARIHALSESPFLDKFVAKKALPTRSGEAAMRRGFEPGTILLRDGRKRRLDALSDEPPETYSRVIDGLKCAYVTFAVGEGFSYGARVLARSLARVTDTPLVILCVPETDKSGLREPNTLLVDIDGIKNPNRLTRETKRFEHTYSKLAAFGLTQWDRLVYVDADAIVLQNIDDLFAHDRFAAAPDIGLDLNYDRFNSGVFCLQPSASDFARMLESLASVVSYDGGDQGFLNELYPDFLCLDRSYNVLKRVYKHHPNLFRLEDVKVLHYVGVKPWQVVTANDTDYDHLNHIWFDFLKPSELLELSRRAPSVSHRRTVARDGSLFNTDSPVLRKARKLRRNPKQFFLDARILRPILERLPRK